jgi:hypothetical protein
VPEPTVSFGPRLQLPAAPYDQKQVPRSVLGGSDSLLVRRSLGDFLGLCYGLCLFWNWFLLLQAFNLSRPAIISS